MFSTGKGTKAKWYKFEIFDSGVWIFFEPEEIYISLFLKGKHKLGFVFNKGKSEK